MVFQRLHKPWNNHNCHYTCRDNQMGIGGFSHHIRPWTTSKYFWSSSFNLGIYSSWLSCGRLLKNMCIWALADWIHLISSSFLLGRISVGYSDWCSLVCFNLGIAYCNEILQKLYLLICIKLININAKQYTIYYAINI